MYCQLKSSMVHSSILRFLETPALLIRMSIWNLPVLGCEKWFLAVVMIWAGPVGMPISASVKGFNGMLVLGWKRVGGWRFLGRERDDG